MFDMVVQVDIHKGDMRQLSLISQTNNRRLHLYSCSFFVLVLFVCLQIQSKDRIHALTMSIRKASTKHTLPANPSWLEFTRSDGNKSLWPTNTQRVVDHEGHVNYMRPAGLDESLCIDWRKKVGLAVARALNMPGTPQ